MVLGGSAEDMVVHYLFPVLCSGGGVGRFVLVVVVVMGNAIVAWSPSDTVLTVLLRCTLHWLGESGS
jgi:hypothetical protein